MLNEEECEAEKMFGKSKELDENSIESEDEQDNLCMIPAEAKRRNQDREMQTDPSSGTYNLDCDDTNKGEELEMTAVCRKPFRELSCSSNIRTNLKTESDKKS